MIKITFEVSEDFIRENATPEAAIAKARDGGEKAIKALLDSIGFKRLERCVNEGKTEFVVTTDKLDSKSEELYDNEIGTICILAAFSETDKKNE